MRTSFIAFVVALLVPALAAACPRVAGFLDFNCDGEIHIAIGGDSLVTGIGDTKNGNSGGYVLRASRRFPSITFHNLGDAGAHTGPYLRLIEDSFRGTGSSRFKDALLIADIFVVDLGRNDRWEFGLPKKTLRNLKRIASIVKSRVEEAGEVAPLVVQAVLMLPNRGSQGPWVAELNSLIRKSHRSSAPADLRFDLVSKRLLGEDQIHPTSSGYDSLASTFAKYLNKKVGRYLLAQRPDADSDGIFDLFETSRYLTDPANPDTDGDGATDGAEVFELLTNPLE